MNNKVVLKDFPKYCIDVNGEIYTSYNKNGKKKLKKFLTDKGYFCVTLYKKRNVFVGRFIVWLLKHLFQTQSINQK